MGVHRQVRKKDAATIYFAVFTGPDGNRMKIKHKVVPGSAPQRDHQRARDAARNYANEQRAAVENGTWTDPRDERLDRPLTFEALVKQFLANYRTRSGQMFFYEQRSKQWLEHFGRQTPARTITVSDVDRFRRARSRIASDSTVRKDLVTLSTLSRWAQVRKLVEANPADYRLIRRPSEPKHQRGYLTYDQEAALVGGCPPWLGRVVRWAINSGMDRQEVIDLTWGAVDELAGTVHATRSKTGVPRDVPLNGTLRSILGEAKRVRNVAGRNQVFLTDEGQPIALNAVKSGLRRAYKRAGISVAGEFKIFRHTFASRLAMSGHSAQSIARLMGHTTTTVTDTYMHLSPDHLRGVMESLDTSREAVSG